MRLRMGMIGGGIGSLIGPVHRMAARLDGLSELVCGAFSSNPAVSSATGEREPRQFTRIRDMAGDDKKGKLPA